MKLLVERVGMYKLTAHKSRRARTEVHPFVVGRVAHRVVVRVVPGLLALVHVPKLKKNTLPNYAILRYTTLK